MAIYNCLIIVATAVIICLVAYLSVIAGKAIQILRLVYR